MSDKVDQYQETRDGKTYTIRIGEAAKTGDYDAVWVAIYQHLQDKAVFEFLVGVTGVEQATMGLDTLGDAATKWLVLRQLGLEHAVRCADGSLQPEDGRKYLVKSAQYRDARANLDN